MVRLKMAKKKQIELIIEEKLKNTLVPKEEQPYKIPSNWCWIRLLESFVNKTDSKKKIKQKDYLEEGNYPIVDQGRDLIGGYTNDDKLIIYIKKPIIVFGDHTRCIKYINFDFVQGADGTKILEPKKIFLEKYFYYAFKNINIPSLGYRRHYPMFNKLKIQIAPINEQQRIVNRIESLFVKLDRAKELIENTLAQFEQNKMAILHKAFTGELTVKWRKENNINEKNFFNKVKLKNVIKLISGRDVSVSLCNDKSIGIPYILGASNIKDNKFFIERWIENPVVVSEKNDILLSVKGTIGKLYLQKEEKINISRQIMALRALNELNTHYLYYFLLRECERLKFEGNGLIPGISRKDILDLNILLPTLEEQQEIVNILDRLLAKYNKIKNLEQQLEKIELLKKAILAKAFRGELGTNNPDEESAENLLKEILAEK
jgi:type I restriction enzyme S subunit